MPNKQPWDGEIKILIRTAGRELTTKDVEFLVTELQIRFENDFVSAEIEYVEGEFGDPSDLM